MSGQPDEALVPVTVLLDRHTYYFRRFDTNTFANQMGVEGCSCGFVGSFRAHLAAVVSEYVEAREREVRCRICGVTSAEIDRVGGLLADRVEHPDGPRSAVNHTDGIRVPQDAETPSDRRPDAESGTPDAEGPMHERLTDVLVWFTPGDRARAEEIAQAVIDAGFRDGGQA